MLGKSQYLLNLINRDCLLIAIFLNRLQYANVFWSISSSGTLLAVKIKHGLINIPFK